MIWVLAFAVFWGWQGYIYGDGWGGAVIAFVFWFLVAWAVRTVFLNATRNKRDPDEPEG